MTTPTLEEHLRRDAIVLEAAEHERTGAQAIEPGHVARTEYRVGQLPKRFLPMTADDIQFQCVVQQFLNHQSELLDRKNWEAYIDLFCDDGLYWMPAATGQSSWEDEPSIFAEDKSLMRVRMGRLTHPAAWSQAPIWVTSHMVANVVIEEIRSTEVVVRSRFHAVELRRDAPRHFAGSYRHWLIKKDGDFKIRLQRVDLLNANAPFDYVIQAWL